MSTLRHELMFQSAPASSLVRLMPLAVVSLLLAAPKPAPAITWCHDYVYSVISGGYDSNRLQPEGDPASTNSVNKNGLRKELIARGYVQVAGVLFHFTGQASDSSFLRDGDVLIFAEAHSGVVVDDTGHINHFLQNFEHQGVAYTIAEAFKAHDDVLNTSLLRRRWTLDEIRNFRYNVPGLVSPPPAFKNVPIQVWRPSEAQLMTDWARIKDHRFGAPIANTFAEYPGGLDADFALSYMCFNFTGGRKVWLFLATKRINTSVREVIFVDPDDGQWSGWSRAYDLHILW